MFRVYKVPVIDYGKVRKSQVLPDQTLSIQEIVKRYVKGVPVDIARREAVYVDQNDHDLEKLSRMDFGEKAEYAQAMKQRADRLKTEFTERVKSAADEKAKSAKDAADKAAAAQKPPAGGSA